MIRVSRLNYNKVWRCPTWSGGGWTSSDRTDCNASFASFIFERRGWRWRFTRCPECGVTCLPDASRWLDPTYLWWHAGRRRKTYGLWPYNH